MPVKVLLLMARYAPDTAISLRIKYFIEALRNKGFDIRIHEIKLPSSKLMTLLSCLRPRISSKLEADAT